MRELALERTDHGAWEVLRVRGEVDLATAPELDQALASLGPMVAVDFSALEFMDSSGLRVLIDHGNRLEAAGGALVIARPRDRLRRLLHVSGVDGRFRLVDELEELESG